MAKKKQARDKKKSGLGDLPLELVGFTILVLVVLMVGQLGLIGQVLRRVIVIFFGDFFWFFGGIMMYWGFKLVVTRKKPSFFSGRRQIGIYLTFLALIVFGHLSVFRHFQMSPLSFSDALINYYFIRNVATADSLVGGGVIGALIYLVFVPLVNWMGLIGIAFLIFIYGILLILEISLKDLYDKRKKGLLRGLFTKIRGRFTKVKEPSITMSEPPKKQLEKESKLGIRKKKEPVDDIKITDFTDSLDKQESKEPTLDVTAVRGDFVLPPISLLKDYEDWKDKEGALAVAKDVAKRLENTFVNFDVRAKVSAIQIGPTVTRFEVAPDAGVKVSKVVSLSDDIALALAVKGIRMEAPIPGKSAIGIEVPNTVPSMVSFKEILREVPKGATGKRLLCVMGRDISGEMMSMELNKMPHLLVAGATGSGKSVCINTMICSLLMRSAPTDVRLLLIDPKKVELARYNGLPHLLAPVVTDAHLANKALHKVVVEMERRYELFSEAVVRDITSYNEYVTKYSGDKESAPEKLPFIVVILDELADLMLVAAREVEDSIMRLTQMARAAGIHLVVATQRPSVDVITGVIKSNIPSRIAFGVSSGVDSRTILDMVGAEKLLGRGDMLLLPMGAPSPVRVQGAFISDEEVARIVEFIKGQATADKVPADFLDDVAASGGEGLALPSDDPLIKEVLAYILESEKVSTSLLQRRFKIGYNRAARIVDDLEIAGLVSTSDGNKPREVLMDADVYQELVSS